MYKILVVDDEPKIREVIREYAEFSGFEVTEAEDGMSAVGLCKLNDYDLIVMDIMMPKLDGFTACKQIKKIKQVSVAPLIADAIKRINENRPVSPLFKRVFQRAELEK